MTDQMSEDEYERLNRLIEAAWQEGVDNAANDYYDEFVRLMEKQSTDIERLEGLGPFLEEHKETTKKILQELRALLLPFQGKYHPLSCVLTTVEEQIIRIEDGVQTVRAIKNPH
jgi:hypothetical protein